MGFYSRVVFPRLCDLLLDTPLVGSLRKELLAHAAGDVLEIGFGTGLNLPHYPEPVRRITAIDANRGMQGLAAKRIRQARIEVDQHVASGERLPFRDFSFDCVVSTFTLCSIDDLSLALREMYRVLKSGSPFLFLEHGLSPDPGVQKWQRRLNWLQMRLGNGCRLDRNIARLVEPLPFSSLRIDEFYLQGTPRTHGYLYRGIAAK